MAYANHCTCFCPWTLNLPIAIVLLRLGVHYSLEIKRYKSQIRIRIVHLFFIARNIIVHMTLYVYLVGSRPDVLWVMWVTFNVIQFTEKISLIYTTPYSHPASPLVSRYDLVMIN